LKSEDKSYPTEKEYTRRKAIFENTLRYVEDINSQNLSWKAGINKFSDWTKEEFQYVL